MRVPAFAILIVLAVSAAGALHAQVANPIPDPVVTKGLNIQIREIARLPESRGRYEEDATGYARISLVRDLPDGRRFAVDARGFLYVLGSNNQPSLYLDLASHFPFALYSRLTSGFTSFAFHPEFARNGLFYTVHGEVSAGNPGRPNFIPPGFTAADVNHHNVVTEWRATNPAANTFQGNRREVLRIAQVVDNLTHPMSFLAFNPTARPGDPDYGLLYTSGSDYGFSNGGGPKASNPSQTQRLDTIATAILRIDPRSPSQTGGAKGLGDYTIPAVNKFQADGDPNTLGEIYAYGFRNANRLSWDTDGTLFASDIGMSQIEEVNIVREGENYGWMTREGYFDNAVNRPNGVLRDVHPLPENILTGRNQDDFTYPVAVYDHDEGRSITGGLPYRGRIPALRGKFIFGDIHGGRLFVSDISAMKEADDGIPYTVAPVEEIQLWVKDASGNRRNVTLRELIQERLGEEIERADLHISHTRDGEILVTSRQDGTIRMLVPDNE